MIWIILFIHFLFGIIAGWIFLLDMHNEFGKIDSEDVQMAGFIVLAGLYSLIALIIEITNDRINRNGKNIFEHIAKRINRWFNLKG